MRRTCLVLGMALALAAGAPQFALAKEGCLKGAAIGGVVRHEVGNGHGVAGAAAGCAIGHHEANKKEAQNAQQKSGSSQPSGSSKGQTQQTQKQQ